MNDNKFLLFGHLFFSAYFGVAIFPWVYFFFTSFPSKFHGKI